MTSSVNWKRRIVVISVALGYLIAMWVSLQPLMASLKRIEVKTLENEEHLKTAAEFNKLTSIYPWEVSYIVAAGSWAQDRAEKSTDDQAKAWLYSYALDRFERARELQPSNNGFTRRIASLYTDWARDLDPKKFEVADRWWSRAVAAQPADWATHRSHGVMLNSWAKQNGDDLPTYRRSLRELQAASKLNPENFDILTYLGRTYLALSQPGKARTALEKALKIQPDYAEAEELLKMARAQSPATPPAPPKP